MLKSIIFLALIPIVLFCQYNDDMNRFMLAQNYEQSGDLSKARQLLEELYTKQPGNPQFFDALNRVYIGLKEYDASIKIISAKIKLAPQDVNLYGMLGSTYYLKGDEKTAYDKWDEGISIDPKVPIAYKIIANHAIERRVFEKAIEYLKHGKKVTNDPFMFAYDLANLYTATMQYKEASLEYLEIVEKEPSQMSMVQQRILTYSSKQEAYEPTLEIFEDNRNKDKVSSAQILAYLYLQGKKHDKAFELYKDIEERQQSRGMELYNFAQNLHVSGEYTMAAKVYDYLLEKYPSSPMISSVKLGYAKTLENSLISGPDEQEWKPYFFNKKVDHTEAAKIITAYEEIIKSFPRTEQANESLYRIGIIKYQFLDDMSGGVEALNKLITQAPVSWFSILANEELALIYLQNGDLSKSEELLTTVVNQGRVKGAELNISRFMLAKVQFYKGDYDKARDLLMAIVMDYKDNNSNDAIELSLLLNTNMNDSSKLLKFAEAEFFAEQKKFTQAAVIFNELAADKEAFMLSGLASIKHAQMETAMDNYDASIRLLSEIGGEKEKNIYSDKALYLLGNIYQHAKKDKTKAIETYEKLLEQSPGSIYLDRARTEINRLRNNLS